MSNRSKKSVVYIAAYDEKMFPGVDKKIKGFILGARKLGFDAKIEQIREPSIWKRISRIAEILLRQKNKNIVIRWPITCSIFLIIPVLVARLRGCFILADVATPRVTALSEIRSEKLGAAKRIIKMAAVVVDGPWALWPVHRIIQYADEGFWFSALNNSKTMLIGNGIDVASIPLRDKPNNHDCKRINFIAVANVEYWHGYDRIIEGFAEYLASSDRKTIVSLKIVGHGGGLDVLKEQVRRLKIEHVVVFTGVLIGDRLVAEYDLADVAVGSLAIHRKNLRIASSLKDREYCAIGMPFVAAGDDPDFPIAYPYRYSVPPDESAVDIQSIIDWYCKVASVEPEEIRAHAIKFCDYEEKIIRMLS